MAYLALRPRLGLGGEAALGDDLPDDLFPVGDEDLDDCFLGWVFALVLICAKQKWKSKLFR